MHKNAQLVCAQVCVGEASPGAGMYVAVSRARVVLLKTEEPRCLHHSITRAWQHLSRVRQVFKRCCSGKFDAHVILLWDMPKVPPCGALGHYCFSFSWPNAIPLHECVTC